MKLTANRQALYAGFQHAGSVVGSAMARPIYSHVKLEVSEDGATLSATDLEVGLVVRLDGVEVQEGGVALLPPERVTALLRATPDETVTLEGDETAVTLRTADGTFRILSEDPSDFAGVPALADGPALEVDPEVLHYMVRRTTFAAAEEKGRFALNGVLLLVGEDGTMEMVAADGARLADVKKRANNPGGLKIDCIVMRRGIEHAARLGALSEAPLRLQATETQFLAENPAGRVCCQLVEGQFPNFREVIPRDCKHRAEVATGALLSALRRASFLTSEQTRVVTFTFSPGRLVVTAQSPDLGEAEVRLDVDYQGEETSIAFNPRYVEQMLDVVERESVKVEFNDARSPCLIRSGLDYLYVVSPVVREEPVE